MYTFTTEDNHESKRAKGINQNVSIMKITKLFCSIDHIWDIEWTEFKANIIICDCVQLVKFFVFLQW